MHIPSKLKTLACGAIGIAAALAFAFNPIPSASALPPAKNRSAATSAAASGAAMPVAQQNALVEQYCEVCHNEAFMNGGISFEHFDAAHADPGDAAMMLAKLKTGAIGAAGKPIPDKPTIAAWIAATSAEAAGANQWVVNQTQNPATKSRVLIASIVQSTPSAANPEQPDLYRLTVTCSINTREGQIQLLWSPGTPSPAQEISAAIDGKGQFQYRAEGSEKMGTGGTSGPGAIALFATNEGTAENSSTPKVAMALPTQSLTLSNLIDNETIAFPFDALPKSTREQLTPCFTASGANQ